MQQWPIVPIAILLAASSVHAKIAASLKPSASQDASIRPYRSAELTVANDHWAIIGSVSLRAKAGGGEFIYPLTLAPNTTGTFPLALPALSPHQTYAVRFLELPRSSRGDGEEIAALDVSIDWPVALVNPAQFIDPQEYRKWEYEFATWPGQVKRTIFMIAAIGCVAMAATLLINRPAIRVGALAAIIALSAVAMSVPLWGCPLVIDRRWAPGRDEPASQSLIVVTSRRTTNWRPSDTAGIWPLYFSREQMADDSLTITDGRDVRLTLSPQQVRLFRQRR